MKKETKRYSIVEYVGVTNRTYKTYDEYKELLNIIEKSNKRKTSKYYFGNVCKFRDDEGNITARIHIYNRLTMPMTITEIDNLTSNITEDELIEYFKDKLKTKEEYYPDINIMYFENKNVKEKVAEDVDRRIKYLPILYKEDTMYLDESYLKKCLYSHASERDYKFFKDLAREFSLYKVVSEYIEKIFIAAEKCKNEGYDYKDMYYASCELLNNLIVERDKDGRILRDTNGKYQISRRRLRDFGFFIRDYNMQSSKKVLPTKYNKSGRKRKKYNITEESSLEMKLKKY